MSDVINVNDDNFKAEVLDSTGQVLVDFGATWCGPCHRQMAVLEPFATQNKDKVKVVTIDVDEAPNLAKLYSVKSVPTLLMFVQGQLVDTKVGLTNTAGLEALVKAKLEE